MTRTVGLGPEPLSGADGSAVGSEFLGVRGAMLAILRCEDGRRGRNGETEREDGASAASVGGEDSSAVCFDDSAADRQPQPDPAAARTGRCAEEFLKDTALGAGRQSRPTVGDLDENLALVGAGGDLDRAVRRRVLKC